MSYKSIINAIDFATSNIAVSILGEKNGLSTFLFHGVNKDNKISKALFPQEELTINRFKEFIETFLNIGYKFIWPSDILEEKLQKDKKYGLITFDDGYFNNTWIQDILKEYKTPAVFFISTGLMINNEKNWSDIIYFERKKRNQNEKLIRKEIISLNPLPVVQIKDFITNEFGINSFKPQGDEDRPLNPAELKSFSQQPYVIIGNHSHNHEVLKNLCPEKIKTEIKTSQKILTEITGLNHDFISYPYGGYSEEVISISKALGYKLGITTIQKKNNIPISQNEHMTLNRFNPIYKNGSFMINKMRSRIQVKTMLKGILQ